MKIYARYRKLSLWNKIGIWGAVASIFGILLFFISQYLGPTKDNQEIIKKDLNQVVKMLQDELNIKNEHIELHQVEITTHLDIYPSDYARQLAQKIPDDAGPYALALKAIAQSRFKDARYYLDIAQEKKEKDLAEIYITRGQTELYAGKYKEAIKWSVKALELAPENIDIIREAGSIFFDNAMYDKAEPLLRKVLEINKESSGINNSIVTSSQNHLALLMLATKRYEEVEPLLQSVLESDEKSYGKEHPLIAAHLYDLACMYMETKRDNEVRPILDRIFKIVEKSENQKDPIVAIVLNNMVASFNLKPIELSIDMMRQAVHIVEKYDPNSPYFSYLLIGLSKVLIEANHFGEAESTILRAMDIDKQSFGENSIRTAGNLISLANLFRITGRFSEAEPILYQALSIYEQSSEDQQINIACVLNLLGSILIQMNHFSEADPLLRKALTIYEQSFGVNHIYYASCLNNLAVLLKETEQYIESEPIMRKVISIVEQNVGNEHPDYAKCINNLAHLLQSTNRLSEAELLFRQSLSIDERYYGENNISVASDLSDLASLLLMTNQSSEAKSLFNISLNIYEKKLGSEHPETQFVRKKLDAIK